MVQGINRDTDVGVDVGNGEDLASTRDDGGLGGSTQSWRGPSATRGRVKVSS